MVSVLKQSRSRSRAAVGKQTVSGFTYFLYMLFVISFFLHLASRIPGVSAFRPDFLLALLIMIMLFVQQDIVKDRLANPCNKYLFVLLIYIALSLPFVEWPGSVLKNNLQDFIKAIVFFYFTLLIIDTDKRLNKFLIIFIACQLFRVLEPLYLNITEGYWGSRTHVGGGQYAARLSGAPRDVINPNGLAFVIVTVLPFLHYLWGNSRGYLKITYLGTLPPLLYALVLTASRSGFVALLVVLWNIFIKSKNKIILIIAAITIAIFAWGSMSEFQRDRYLSLTGDEGTVGYATYKGRLDGWIADFKVGMNKPVFGHGIGTSAEALWHGRQHARISHNMYAETFIEIGIIGFILFMLFIKSVYTMISNTYKQIENRNLALSMPERELNYYKNLLIACKTCFWMYIIFSLAQYGLNEYHWYFLAGLVCIINYVFTKKLAGVETTDGTSRTG